MNFRSLKAKLILLNASIVGFMSAGAMFLLYTSARDLKYAQLDDLRGQLNALSQAIQDQFYERYGDVKAFAAVLGTDGVSNIESKQNLLNSYVSLYGIYDLILFVDTEGNLIASNTRDSSGNPLDISALSGAKFTDAPWFRAAQQKDYNEDRNRGFTEVVLEQPHFDSIVESVYRKPSYGTSFTTPVMGKGGKLVGYVSTRAGFRWVEDSVQRSFMNLKAKGHTSGGFLVYGNDGKVFVNYLPDQNNNSLEFSRDRTKVGSVTINDLAELAPSGLAPGRTGYGSYEETGTQHMRTVAFQPINGPKMISGYWNVAAHFDDSEAFAASDRLVKMFLVILSLASATALVSGLIFGTRLSRKLQDLVTRLYRQGTEVRDASALVSETSQQLSSAAAQQAAALQQTVAAVNEISAMVGRTADMANQSRKTSESSRSVAHDGKSTVDEMLESMTLIKESNRNILAQVEDGNKEISQIVKVISEIGNKTKVINEIVFQTKLLSFNASVEAARAGEHGKGFAVVAEEVGNLAQMSGTAAKEISELLEQSVVKVQAIVDQTGLRVEKLIVDAREKVALGEDTAKRCASMLEQILVNADEVNSLISEIATSAQEQARGVQEINSAMTELDNVTQQNSSSAAQASALSGSLRVQSESLSDLVSSLNGVLSGVGHDAASGEEISRGNVTRNSDSDSASLSPSPTGGDRDTQSNGRSNLRDLKSRASAARGNHAGSSERSSRANRSANVGQSGSSGHADGSSALQLDVIPRADDPRFED